MSRTERSFALWDVLLDAHVRVAEANQGNLVAFLGKHNLLVNAIRGILWLVVPGKLLSPVVYHGMYLLPLTGLQLGEVFL